MVASLCILVYECILPGFVITFTCELFYPTVFLNFSRSFKSVLYLCGAILMSNCKFVKKMNWTSFPVSRTFCCWSHYCSLTSQIFINVYWEIKLADWCAVFSLPAEIWCLPSILLLWSTWFICLRDGLIYICTKNMLYKHSMAWAKAPQIGTKYDWLSLKKLKATTVEHWKN